MTDHDRDRERDQEHEHDTVIYELHDWSPDERGALEMRLEAAAIEHRWEAGDQPLAEPPPPYGTGHRWAVWPNLVVNEEHEDAVDALLDEVEFPDALEGVDDEEASDEDVYAVMGNLYTAADKLKNDPADLAVAGEFFDAADVARGAAAPYGIDGDVWSRVQSLATTVTERLEAEAPDDEVGQLATELRDLLFQYV
jgi:hypothetical protein